MIALHRADKSLVRIFPHGEARRVEFHRRFGFVSEDSLRARRNMRAGAGALSAAGEHEFSFQLAGTGHDFLVTDAEGCRAERAEQGWKIESEHGAFYLRALEGGKSANVEWKDQPFSYKPHLYMWSAVLAVLLLIVLWPNGKTEVQNAKSEEIAPVIIQTQKAPVEVKAIETPADPQTKAKQKIRQQLGFLKLAGRKDFKKVVGGMPTPTAQATAGAGPGGTEGSGGELLAGMGKGLHKTTVGNTGVTGLGGVGTKGAGGGLGGYGDTAYAAAGGAPLSAIPLAQDAKIDEGLDRSQIQSTIMRYLSQVRACYEEGLKRNQALIGQVTMGFEVGGSGNLNSAQVQRTSLNDRPVEECIRTKMMNWKFPQPRGGVNVKVSYPFMLRPLRN